MDASNIIKPALSRGELQCVGATTMNEYRKYIEKDAALERRFQTIKVDAPTVDEAIQILKVCARRTRRITKPSSLTKRSRLPLDFPIVTSPAAFFPIKPLMLWTRQVRALESTR